MSLPESAAGTIASRRAAYAVLAATAALALLLGALFRPAGGLRATYATSVPGSGVVTVHQRVDPAIDFPVPQRLDAAYIEHWNLARHGFPANMPPYFIGWRGWLEVPRTGTYGFAVEARGETSVRIDDTPLELRPDTLTERPLAAGRHALAVDYTLVEGEARIVLKWRPPGGRLAVLDQGSLLPDASAPGAAGARRAAAVVLVVALALGVAAAGLAARREGSRAARAVALLAPERTRLALGAVVILAALLRFHDYALVPFHHETADEYQHAWEGWSLLHHGEPAAWSTFPDRYPIDRTMEFRWFGDRYVVVRPYFDHPPLFSIPVGLASTLAAAWSPPLPPAWSRWDFLQCRLSVMRIVPILLSLAGILLLYRLARACGASEEAALLGTLVYATVPIVIAAHRLVKAESLLAVLLMGAILAARRHEETGSARSALAAGLLCGLSIWTKATGVAVVAVVVVLLAGARRYRGAATALAVTAGCGALYLLYAGGLDFGIFRGVVEAQATSKWVALESIHDLLGGKVVVKWFGRGEYLFLLFCAGLVALRAERRLLMPLAIYATIVALTADHRVIYGWYRIPMYPFLCVAAGIVLVEMIRASDLARVLPFAVTALASGLLYALPESLVKSRGVVLAFASVAVAPYVLRLAHERPWTSRLARAATYGLVAIWLATSVATVGNFLEIYAATRGAR